MRPIAAEIDDHGALEALGELVARERAVEIAGEAQVRGAALDDLVDPQLAIEIADRVVELGREERGDVGLELELLLADDVREERRAVLVEVHALLHDGHGRSASFIDLIASKSLSTWSRTRCSESQ